MIRRPAPLLLRLYHRCSQPSHSQCEDSVEAILANHEKKIQKLSGQLINEHVIHLRETTQWRKQIEPSIKDVFQVYRKHKFHPLIVGSAMTGLADPSKGSDVDVVLYTSKEEDVLDRSRLSITSNPAHSTAVLNGALRKLQKSGIKFRLTSMYSKIKYPIMKLLISNKQKPFTMEISVDSVVHARNSLFVRHCVQMDKRVTMLYQWVQQWLRTCDLYGSSRGKFSSYHTILLVIHFLQYTEHSDMKPVLPVMLERYPHHLSAGIPFPEIYDIVSKSTMPVDYKPGKNDNKMQIGELVVRFVDFYSRVNLHDFALDVSSGKNIERLDEDYDRINLVDPYSAGISVCRMNGAAGQLSASCELTKHAFSLGRGLSLPLSFTGSH
uniref:PAP-associated domain-containing protein n=1 Tax=Steinernema glaseri TaxID=37863 RepID=A0A1I7Z547_9BILA